MQPISAPMYPNCFDQLTTHGIIAEDVMGYVTGAPSPYLQNYVAQRGGVPSVPSMPGQIMPDPLPTLQSPRQHPTGPVTQHQQQALPQGDVYSSIKKDLDTGTVVKKDKYDKFKKIGAAILLTGLITFGLIKGKGFISRMISTPGAFSSTISNWTSKAGSAIKSGWNKFANWGKSTFGKLATATKNGFNKLTTVVKSGCQKAWNFIKTQWNKIFNKP